MKCGLPQGVSVELPNHDIEVVAEELDIRKRRRNYTVANLQVNDEAGRLLSRYSTEGALAFIKINGQRVDRMYLSPWQIQFKETLREKRVADVQLQDPRKVLRRGSIEKNFDREPLSRIAEYVVSRREDPENVITGVTVEQDTIPESVQAFKEQLDRIKYIQDIFKPRPDAVKEFDPRVTFQWDGVTPLEALSQLTDRYAINWWVEDDGTIRLGSDVSRASSVVATFGNKKDIALKRYTVTEPARLTSAIHLRSPHVVRGESFSISGDSISLIGEAELNNRRGAVLSLEAKGEYTEPSEIQAAAARQLTNTIMDETHGSIEINGMASEKKGVVANMDVGDLVYVDDTVGVRCEREVSTGTFVITSLKHRISETQGWRAILEVSKYPEENSIETRAVFYDPETDKRYDTLAKYLSAREENSGTLP